MEISEMKHHGSVVNALALQKQDQFHLNLIMGAVCECDGCFFFLCLWPCDELSRMNHRLQQRTAGIGSSFLRDPEKDNAVEAE